MELTWWGTAGFRIKTGKQVFLIDPYLSRNENAQPHQYLSPDNINEGDLIFLSHGHFDHLMDVPIIANRTGAKVFCSKETGASLLDKGTKANLIHTISEDGFKVQADAIEAQAFYSEHVRFDMALVLKTIWRAKLGLLKYLRFATEYPPGQVLSWRFKVEDHYIHFFGSAGSTASEMEMLSSKRTDILLVPLQGHNNVCNIALEYVYVMQPSVVIPHHQDDFFPPVSQTIDIKDFIEGVKRECPQTEVMVMEMNETIIL